MTTQVGQQAPVDGGAAPPPADPDAAKYAELAKELEVEGQEPEGEPTSEPVAEPTEPAAKPKPTYEELEEHGRKTAAALRDAREAHKAEQARTDNIVAALREAKERRGQAESVKEPDQPQLPDVQADPIGHFTGRIAQLEEALRHTYQGGQQQTQQITAHLQEQAMWGTVQASEVEIKDPKSTSYKADYDDACRHLEGSRVRQLDRMYPDSAPQVQAMARQQGFATPAEYKLSLLNQDRRAVATHALQNGMSPAQLYYELALDSGYQAKPNGKAPGATLADRAAQQIAAAKKGTKAALTISGDTAGRKGALDMSLPDLADLFVDDPDAADRVWDDMKRAGKL